MEDLETIRRQIRSTETLHSVVRTMKVLSMTSIRQCEEAVESLDDYDRTVRLGLQVAMRHRPGKDVVARSNGQRIGAVVFGSAWGMCGRFNDQIAEYAGNALLDDPADAVQLLALGELVEGRLEDVGRRPDRVLNPPDAVDQITPRVQELLVAIEHLRVEQHVDEIRLYFNETTSGTSFTQTTQLLLPLDQRWLDRLEDKPWPTRMIPTYRMEWSDLFSALVRQYLFVSLYRAFAESLASEHSSRLAAMQVAEDNAEERLSDLRLKFHRQRQRAITEELLDIISGTEALTTPGP